MKTVKNKYNGRIYKVLSFGKTIRLQRDDGSEFEIDASEYRFYYREITDDND